MTMTKKRFRLGAAVATATLSAASVLALASPASATTQIGPPQNIVQDVPATTQNTMKVNWQTPTTGTQLNFLEGFAVSFNGPLPAPFPSPIDPDEVIVNVPAVAGQVNYSATATGLLPGTPYNITVTANVPGDQQAAYAGPFFTSFPPPSQNLITCYAPFNSWDALVKQNYRDFLNREPRLDELVFWSQKLQSSPQLPIYSTGPSWNLLNANGTSSGLFLTGVRSVIGNAGNVSAAQGYGLFRANNGAPNVTTNPYVPATAGGAPDTANAYPQMAPPGAANRVYITETGQVRVVGTNAVVPFTPVKLGCQARVRADLVVFLYEEARQTYGPAVRLYNAVFPKRLGDVGGIEFWRNQLASGKRSLEWIANYFTTSSEFRTTYETLPDGTVRDLDDAEFVALVYVNVLKRPADGAGVAFWTRQLQDPDGSGPLKPKRTRGGVLLGFSESNEYTRFTSHEVQTTVLVNSLSRNYKDPDKQVAPSTFDISKSKDVARFGLDSVNVPSTPSRLGLFLDARSFLPVEEPTPVFDQADDANRYPANNNSFAFTHSVWTTKSAYLASITK